MKQLWGTRSRVFSQTLAQGNSKNEINDDTEEERMKRRVNIWNEVEGTKKRSPDGLIIALGPTVPRGAIS